MSIISVDTSMKREKERIITEVWKIKYWKNQAKVAMKNANGSEEG